MRRRWIRTSLMNAYRNLAIEEALFLLQEDATVRVWESEKSVVIGRAQLASHETNLPYCQSRKIPIARRFTAGGAVYHGPGNVNWSFFIGRAQRFRHHEPPWNAVGAFGFASSLITESLRRLGVACWSDEPNRIITADGKISGMAAYLSKRGALCHGTMLIGADLEEARLLTTPSGRPLERKYVRSRNMQMTNIGVGQEAFVQSLRGVVEEELDGEIEASELTEGEVELAETLVENKYRNSSWNLGDPFANGGAAK